MRQEIKPNISSGNCDRIYEVILHSAMKRSNVACLEVWHRRWQDLPLYYLASSQIFDYINSINSLHTRRMSPRGYSIKLPTKIRQGSSNLPAHIYSPTVQQYGISFSRADAPDLRLRPGAFHKVCSAHCAESVHPFGLLRRVASYFRGLLVGQKCAFIEPAKTLYYHCLRKRSLCYPFPRKIKLRSESNRRSSMIISVSHSAENSAYECICCQREARCYLWSMTAYQCPDIHIPRSQLCYECGRKRMGRNQGP